MKSLERLEVLIVTINEAAVIIIILYTYTATTASYSNYHGKLVNII